MDKCQHCPLKDSDKECPDQPYYCKHVERESRNPYGKVWTKRLLIEAERPPKKLDPCQTDTVLVPKTRPSGLEHEVVVSRYKEWTGWVNDCPLPVILYDKCPGSNEDIYNENIVVHRVPNLGREAHTILHHIVSHYHDLANWTYFVQGATHSGVELFGRLALEYHDLTGLTAQYADDFPSDDVKRLDKVERHGDYWVRYGRADLHGNRSPAKNRDWLCSVWSRWFDAPQPEDWYFIYAAEMAVPRHRILARPLEDWQEMLAAVSQATSDPKIWDSDPATPWAFELLWGYLFNCPETYPLKRVKPLEKTPRKRVTVQEARELGYLPPKAGGCGCGGNK